MAGAGQYAGAGGAQSQPQREYHNVSLKVEAGEVVSIVGLLGAGRTELCLSLFGMTRPDSGEILINGQPVRLRSNQDAIRHGIGYVSEDRMSRGLGDESVD